MRIKINKKIEKIKDLPKMSSEDIYSEYSDYSDYKGKKKDSKYYTNSKNSSSESKCDYKKSSYSEKCRTSDSYDNKCNDSKYDNSDCYDGCGIRESKTPVGVWNLVYFCDTACTTDGSMEWYNQLLLNGDKTLNLFSAPDVGTNPFPCQVSPGSGVWELISDRKIKLDTVHIGYRCQDGQAQYYLKLHMVFKLNRKGTRLRFCGEARTYDIKDPRMCTRTDIPALCFSGHGVKVLEPKC